MQTEIEVKFSNIDIADIQKRLKAAGGVCEQPMRLMKRVVIQEPHHVAEHSFIRIRDEGNRVMLAFKRRKDPYARALHDVKEIEVEVSDFDATVELFREAGWSYVTLQENRRETWHLNDVEVVIDEWPWLKPYIEIEGETEENLKEAAKKLNLDWDKVIIGNIDVLYEHEYHFQEGFRGVIDLTEVRFDDPLPPQFTPKEL